MAICCAVHLARRGDHVTFSERIFQWEIPLERRPNKNILQKAHRCLLVTLKAPLTAPKF